MEGRPEEASGYRRRQDHMAPLEGWGSQDGAQRPAGRALTVAMRLGTAAEQPGQAGARKGRSRLEGTCHPHTSQQLGLSPAAVGDDSDEAVRWDRAAAGG